MTETIKLKGLSCNHCVMRVKKALEEVEGVEEASISLENSEAEVTHKSNESLTDTLKQAVIKAGYEVE